MKESLLLTYVYSFYLKDLKLVLQSQTNLASSWLNTMPWEPRDRQLGIRGQLLDK